jgi:hypothetical protein
MSTISVHSTREFTGKILRIAVYESYPALVLLEKTGGATKWKNCCMGKIMQITPGGKLFCWTESGNAM